MKSRKEINEYLYKNRRLRIENQLIDIKLSYNYMGVIVKVLIVLLILSVLSFAYWLGWFVSK